MTRLVRAAAAAACVGLALLGSAPALAQADAPPARALTGALKRIHQAGAVRIGYREGAVPFSYARPGTVPWGYSIDLCLAIVEDISAAIGGKALKVEYRAVSPSDRIELVAGERIDLECGSTTINAERRERVAFSPVIFIAGTRLLVRRGSALHSFRDLGGKTVVTAAGTTNARAMIGLFAGRVKDARIVNAASYQHAMAMLEDGKADALAADDVLIAGLLTEPRFHERYIMVGDPLTHEPYGIAFARDPGLADVVQTTFARLAATRELRLIYNKWFARALPTGARMNLPMGQELERSFQVLGLPPE
jgi:glutamate/aspartate transport system substrate-binding protein